jgi:hypothetical protein
MVRLDFDNGYQEFEIDVEFDYQPYEPATWSEWDGGYPGCSEGVDICLVTMVDTGSEICLLNEDEVEEQVLDEIHERQGEYYD